MLVGDGAEHGSLQQLAGDSPLITFIPRIDNPEELNALVSQAKGFIFPSIEPFGIAPIEALSAGVPVIALKQGGALDYIHEGKNGTFFDKQTVESLVAAMQRFDGMAFNKQQVSASAKGFSDARFKQELQRIVDDATGN